MAHVLSPYDLVTAFPDQAAVDQKLALVQRASNDQVNYMLGVCGAAIGYVPAGSPQHTLAASALHKLRLEACRRTGNLGVQHARAVFPSY